MTLYITITEEECKLRPYFHTHPLAQSLPTISGMFASKNRAAMVAESPLYLDHQQTGCLISASLSSREQRRAWSSLLRLPVKFGQVTVTWARPRPPQRTGSSEQEVIVHDVRRREHESFCLRKSTSKGFSSPQNTILKQIFFFFFFLNREHEAECDLRAFWTFISGALRLSRWDIYFLQPKMGLLSYRWSFVHVFLVNSMAGVRSEIGETLASFRKKEKVAGWIVALGMRRYCEHWR